MNSPAAPKPGTPPFGAIIEQARCTHAEQQRTAFHALQLGVNPDEILSYARGHVVDGFETVLARSPWAMARVVALTKSRRRPESLGSKLLASTGHTDPYVWGIRDTGDRDHDLAALLDQVT